MQFPFISGLGRMGAGIYEYTPAVSVMPRRSCMLRFELAYSALFFYPYTAPTEEID